MNEPKDDRRRFPRLRSENTVLVRKLGPETPDSLTRTRELGLGGCAFLSAESVGKGAEVELTISVRGLTVKARGRVIHERLLKDGTFEVGVEFQQVDPEDARLLEGLFEKPWAIPSETE